MISGFHHFSIACSDADRSAAFYRDVFGMTPVSDRDVPPGGFVEQVSGVAGAHVRIVHLRGYGFNFELLEYRAPRDLYREVGRARANVQDTRVRRQGERVHCPVAPAFIEACAEDVVEEVVARRNLGKDPANIGAFPCSAGCCRTRFDGIEPGRSHREEKSPSAINAATLRWSEL